MYSGASSCASMSLCSLQKLATITSVIGIPIPFDTSFTNSYTGIDTLHVISSVSYLYLCVLIAFLLSFDIMIKLHSAQTFVLVFRSFYIFLQTKRPLSNYFYQATTTILADKLYIFSSNFFDYISFCCFKNTTIGNKSFAC